MKSEKWSFDGKDITRQCYRKFERLVDYLAIKNDKRGDKNGAKT